MKDLQHKINAQENEIWRVREKINTLEKELAEMEERDLKHAQEARELKKKLNQTTRDLEEARSSNGGSQQLNPPATMERTKSGSRLVRSPRERNIPKLADPPTSATRTLPPPPPK